MGVMRDYYEGTPYDMTTGMAAGPHGSPDRFGGAENAPVFAIMPFYTKNDRRFTKTGSGQT